MTWQEQLTELHGGFTRPCPYHTLNMHEQPSASVHSWSSASPQSPGQGFVAVSHWLPSSAFSFPPCCGRKVDKAQSHLVLGVSQAAEGDPPRIWPLVCAVRSSLRNFSPTALQKTHVGLWSAAASVVSLLLNSSNLSFPLGNRMSTREG